MLINQQAHGHHGNPAAADRDDALTLPAADHLRCLVSHSQHGWGIGAVDVGVEQADRFALPGQCAGQIHRDSALADAAFATADGDDLTNAGNPLAFGLLSMARLADAALTGRLSEFDLDVVDAVQSAQQFFGFGGDPLTLALGESGE